MKLWIYSCSLFVGLSIEPLQAIEEALLAIPTLIGPPARNDWNKIFFLEEGTFNSIQKEYKIIAFGNSYRGMLRRGHVQDGFSEWNWGFRSGIGCMPREEHWSFVASYTQFHSRVFAGEESQERVFIPAWKQGGFSSVPQQESSFNSSWRLHINLADVEIGKRFNPVGSFYLHPHVGIRGAWLFQETNGGVIQGDSMYANVFFSNNCAAIGLRTGLDSLWKLGRGLSFFGDGAVGFLSSYYNIGQRSSLLNQADSRSLGGISTAEFSLGMQYEKFLYGKIVTFRMGYEMNYIFNQNRWMDWVTNFKGAVSDADKGMALQGVTLNVRVDF